MFFCWAKVESALAVVVVVVHLLEFRFCRMGWWRNVHRLVWEWVDRPVTRTRHPNSSVVKTCRRGCLVRVKSQVYIHWVAAWDLVCHQSVQISNSRSPLAGGILQHDFCRVSRIRDRHVISATIAVLVYGDTYFLRRCLCFHI